MMKKINLSLLVFFLFFSLTCHAEGIKVTIDNSYVDFDVPPIIENGRTLVPMRKIFEELGCDVEWLAETRTVIATKNSKIIALQIEKNIIVLNDIETGKNEVKTIDTAPVIYNNRTLVPVRVISESLGCEVEWNGEEQKVMIYTK